MIQAMPKPLFTVRTEGGAVVCDNCVIADRPLARLRGLLGRASLEAGEGLLLSPACAVHTWFMRFPIDLVFLDDDRTVLGVRERVRPWRMRACRGAASVLELPAGTCAERRVHAGHRLSIEEATGRGEHAKVLLLVDHGGPDRVVVNGHGSLSAAARTVDAIGDLNLPIGVVVMPDEPHPTAA
jgi:uncharacterized protein